MTGELKLGAGVAENLKLVLPGGAVKYYMKSEYYDAEKNTWCNITLPQQEAGEYVITVVADGETVDVIHLPYEEECLGTQLPEGPMKQGYIFLEWNTQADGKGGNSGCGDSDYRGSYNLCDLPRRICIHSYICSR